MTTLEELIENLSHVCYRRLEYGGDASNGTRTQVGYETEVIRLALAITKAVKQPLK